MFRHPFLKTTRILKSGGNRCGYRPEKIRGGDDNRLFPLAASEDLFHIVVDFLFPNPHQQADNGARYQLQPLKNLLYE